MSARVLFYVQHLMGVGHVFRASRIVRALRREGLEVDLAFGGMPIPGLDIADARIHYLPPVRAGKEAFNKLEDPEGNPVSDAYKEDRRARLLALFEVVSPDVIVTEAFPFGRRQMRFELLPLMEAAHARPRRPVIVSSVRDIIQKNSKPERDREVVELLNTWFDRVLVHGDPEFIRIDETFPHADEIARKVAYTGIVAPAVPERQDGGPDVVVSVGGGAFGHRLLMGALEARRLSTMRDARWLVLSGLFTTDEQKADLRRFADEGIEFQSFVPDLRALLAGAKLSISRAGYNTTADIFAAGCRAVISPLFDGIETEQITRADVLARKGLVQAVPPNEETPEAIAAAIDRAMAGPAPDRSAIDIGGADKAARLIAELARGGPPAA
ncbi:glycosyltransferase family protein [Aquibium oceanicum]|nr:glycosyltransferase [Aquibium oceanicum]